MIKITISIMMVLLMGSVTWGQEPVEHPPEQYDRKDFTEDTRISRGGQLYDNWWKTKLHIDKTVLTAKALILPVLKEYMRLHKKCPLESLKAHLKVQQAKIMTSDHT
jgi:hypothetical protein